MITTKDLEAAFQEGVFSDIDDTNPYYTMEIRELDTERARLAVKDDWTDEEQDRMIDLNFILDTNSLWGAWSKGHTNTHLEL